MTDQDLEKMLAKLLRTGVLISGAIVVLGGCIYLYRHGNQAVDYHVFRPLPASDRSIPQIFRNAFALRGRSIIQLGAVALVATPICRVAFSMVGFAFERDRQYVIITAIVLCILLYGIFSGAGGG